MEAQKKITDFTSRVQQVLKSKSKSQNATLKKELLAFLSSNNIYYSSQKQVVESLLARLENYSTNNDNQNSPAAKSNNFPWKAIFPFLLIGILLPIALIIWAKKVSRKRKK